MGWEFGRAYKIVAVTRLLPRVIVKSGVSAPELGGGLANCFHLDSSSEFHPGNQLSQITESA